MWIIRFILFIYLLFNVIVRPHWDFFHGKFGLLSSGKASCGRVALFKLRAMLGVLSVSIIHRTLIWTTGSLMCEQMLVHAIARGGLRTHVGESALTVDSGKKIPRRNGESNLRQRLDGPMLWLTELHQGGKSRRNKQSKNDIINTSEEQDQKIIGCSKDP